LRALALYYSEIPADDLEATSKWIQWFYACGKTSVQTKGRGRGRNERIYSFEHDDEYIYAAFLEQYGIDLNDVDYLHWWKFKALFGALNDECQIRKIMGYRGMEISDKLTNEQKDFYRKMKETYKIPMSKNEQEKTDAIQEALLNGGDLKGVL